MNIKEQRRRLGISQTRLAKLANVSRFKIALYEIGDGELTARELGRIDVAIRLEASRMRSELDSIELPTLVGVAART